MMLDIPSRPSSKAVCTTRENSLPTTACPSQTTSYSTAKGLRKELTEQIFSGNNAVIER
jgi:iron-sulfur cluster repair protein YtfE (RIC family)